MKIIEATTRPQLYKAIRSVRFSKSAKSADSKYLPLTVSQETLSHIATLLSPKTASWGYCVPGVCEGDAVSYDEALAAAESANGTGVTHSYVCVIIDGVDRLKAW